MDRVTRSDQISEPSQRDVIREPMGVAEVRTLDPDDPLYPVHEWRGVTNAAVVTELELGSGDPQNITYLSVLDVRNVESFDSLGRRFVRYGMTKRPVPDGMTYMVVDQRFGMQPTETKGAEGGFLFLPHNAQDVYVGTEYNQGNFAFGQGVWPAHVSLSIKSDGQIAVQNMCSEVGYTYIHRRLISDEYGVASVSPVHTQVRAFPVGILAVGAQGEAESGNDTLELPVSDGSERAEKAPLPFTAEAGWAEKPLSGEDTLLVDPESQLFGVFDGAGGERNAALAAKVARDTIAGHAFFQHYPDEEQAKDDIKQALINANSAVAERAPEGVTTATVARLAMIGPGGSERPHLVWGSVGDSRLALMTDTGAYVQLSTDECAGRFLTNHLGSAHGAHGEVTQAGVMRVHPGDRIILMTDGITGDVGTDVLSDREISGAVRDAANAEQAATNLIRIARKRDDRTAVVVTLAPTKS